MKSSKVQSKLVLKKETVSNLGQNMKDIMGGVLPTTSIDVICPTMDLLLCKKTALCPSPITKTCNCYTNTCN